MELQLERDGFERNLLTGRFTRGCTPHNKGKKMEDYMSPENKDKILSKLHRKGRKDFGGWNARKIVTVKDGRVFMFESSNDAERKLGISARNIRKVLEGKRETCGGLKWFYADSDDYLHLID